MEQVSFKLLRGSNGWCGNDRMMNEVDGMKPEDYSKDWELHNGKSE